jgi:SAM-dependent methyltransferase
MYHHRYEKVVRALSPLRPVIEIGSGLGNFKEYFPEAVSTDVFQSGPWIDRVMDAHNLDLADGEAGNLVVFDCIHHLQRPLHFLRQAAAALKVGGRLVLFEPAITVWSNFVWSNFHHEPIDINWDLFALDSKPPDPDPGHTFANGAIPEILFWKHRERTMQLAALAAAGGCREDGLLPRDPPRVLQRQFAGAGLRLCDAAEARGSGHQARRALAYRYAHGRGSGAGLMAAALRPVPWRACILIFLAALVFRLALVAITDQIHWFPRKEMVRIAMAFAERGELADPFAAPTGPTALAPPLYPIFLGTIFAVRHWVAAEVVKCLLTCAVSALRCALLPWVAVCLGLRLRTGVIAGILGVFYIGALVTDIKGDWAEAYVATAMVGFFLAAIRIGESADIG